MKEKNYSVTLDIGSGNKTLIKLLKNFTELNQAHEYIKFHGKLTLDEINYFYRKSDIFVFCIMWIIWMLLLESMSSKLPILGSNRSGLDDTCKNGVLTLIPKIQMNSLIN